MKGNSDKRSPAIPKLSATLKGKISIGLNALQDRIAQDRMSEKDFIAAVSDIIAATPGDLGSIDGLLIAQKIREIEHDWKESLKRSLS